MNKYLLAFDAGTGAGRCSLFTNEGTLVGSTYQEWSYFTPADAAPDGREFNANQFWSIFCNLCKALLRETKIDPQQIVGVSTTSQREGMVFLDQSGAEIYAGPNIDNRGKCEYLSFMDREEDIRKITGLRLFTLYGPARLLWFKNHKPDLYDSIDMVLMISDWITYKLCGVSASTPSIASSSQLFNIHTQEWSPEICSLFGLRNDYFPSIQAEGTALGKVTEKAAEETGLSINTIVSAGGGDTHLGLLGVGVNEPCISAIAGTSTPVMAVQPSIDMQKCQTISTSCYSMPKYWTLESNAGMTGMSYRWVRDVFAKDIIEDSIKNNKDPYEELNRMAADIQTGTEGWKAYIGTGPVGARSSNLGGFIFPLHWILDKYDRRHLIRAAIETMVFGIRAHYDNLKRITQLNQESFSIGGGQTKSTLFNQLLSDTLGLPISTYKVKEATALGAAMCAAVGAGLYKDLSECTQSMTAIEKVYLPDPSQAKLCDQAYLEWEDFGKYLNKYQYKET